ncbi:MAG TPA: hypothetical protein DCR40_09370 [Prolixibacteraceae bacterium]|nr:hypothetical protein [Prolixibacteraceae bacterium]
MKHVFISILVISIVWLVACTEQVEMSQDNCLKYAELDYSNYDSLKTDPITVISAKVDGDCLLLNLQYGGGCKEHQVNLALTLPECGTPPLPPPTFEIRHNANGDVCKALITKDYSFDIFGIKEKGKSQTEFILNTKNSSGVWQSTTYTYKY